MLDTIPHDQAFSQLLITQMVTYRDKCLEWYKALVSSAQASADNASRTRRVAALASSGDIHALISKLWLADKNGRQELLEKVGALTYCRATG